MFKVWWIVNNQIKKSLLLSLTVKKIIVSVVSTRTTFAAFLLATLKTSQPLGKYFRKL